MINTEEPRDTYSGFHVVDRCLSNKLFALRLLVHKHLAVMNLTKTTESYKTISDETFIGTNQVTAAHTPQQRPLPAQRSA